MNRMLRTTIVTATVLLSGAVAFAVAASTSPPDATRVAVVVTDRPIQSAGAPPVSSAMPLVPSASVTPTSTAATVIVASKPVASARHTVVRARTRPSKPTVIKVPAVVAVPPKDSDDDEHEVVTPPVRDSDDDSDHGDSLDSDGSHSTEHTVINSANHPIAEED